MPLLSISTNIEFDSTTIEALESSLAPTIANTLGKSVDYVMTRIEHTPNMTFGGTKAPMAYVALKSIGGLSAENTQILSELICRSLEKEAAISSQRIYIEFNEAARHLWGWNNKTFA